MRHLGRSLKRREDARLLAGRGGFVEDVRLEGELHMAVVRSPVASGVLRGLDTVRAFELGGVHAVWTAEDVAGLDPLPMAGPEAEAFSVYRQRVIGGPQVRHVGEPIAVVFAESRAIALDAAERVEADIDHVTPVVDATRSPTAFDPDLNSTEIAEVETEFGQLETSIGRADRVIDLALSIGRQAGMPLETRAALANLEPASDTVRLWTAATRDRRQRALIARWLGRPESSVEIRVQDAGGSFGVRNGLSPEELLVCLAAVRLERPVRWTETRGEHLVAADQAREQHHRARVAARNDGRLLAIETQFWLDQGAYPRPATRHLADLTATLVPGPYRLDAYRGRGRVMLTNKTPAGFFRGAGRTEATFVRERLVDALAATLGHDPLDLRLKNLVEPNEMPFDRQLSLGHRKVVYEAGDYPLLIDKARRRFSLDLLQRRIADRREQGELVGVGFAFFLDESARSTVAGCRVTLDTTGYAEVRTGYADAGQGIRTTLSQVVADVVGLPYERIRVRTGVTELTAWQSPEPVGQSVKAAATAALLAAEKARTRVLEAASRLMQVEPERLTVSEGRVREADRHFGAALEIAEVVASLEAAPHARDGDGLSAPGLSVEAWFNADQPAHPYGLHVAVVEIDRPTGIVRVPRYFVAYDVGTAIHPQAIETQIAAGVVQGLGGALFEGFGYDENGTPLSTNLSSYGVPSARDVPEIDILVTEDSPNPLTPLGLKRAGEAGIHGAAAAVANAVDRALGIPGAADALPITPARIRSVLRESETGEARDRARA